MKNDYLLERVTLQIKRLKNDVEHLDHEAKRIKRDEQFAIDRLKRDFAGKIKANEDRQVNIAAEIRFKEHEFSEIENRIKLSAPKKNISATEASRKRRLGPHL